MTVSLAGGLGAPGAPHPPSAGLLLEEVAGVDLELVLLLSAGVEEEEDSQSAHV